MKRLFSIGAVVFILASASVAVARNDGDDATIVWAGEVHLSAPVSVARGQRLQIGAGTHIQIESPDAVIVVEGQLLIEGRKGAPVVFTVPGDWQGITLCASRENNRVGYAVFRGGRTALTIRQSGVAIEHSRFENVAKALVVTQKSSARISSSRFLGGDFAVIADMRSAVTVTGSRFSDIADAAISSSRLGLGEIRGNLFIENGKAIAVSQEFSGAIVENIFRDNQTGVFLVQSQATPRLEKNVFRGQHIAVYASRYSSPKILGNLFLDNEKAIQVDKMSFPQVLHNHLSNNEVAVDVRRRSMPLVQENLIKNSTVGLMCDYSAYPVVRRNNFVGNVLAVKLGDNQSAEFDNNVDFAIPGEQYKARTVLVGPTIRPSPTAVKNGIIDVSQNWWGEQTPELLSAGADFNARIFWDRLDQPFIPTSAPGHRYQRDRIEFHPVLPARVDLGDLPTVKMLSRED